jgi:hypothetical protein
MALINENIKQNLANNLVANYDADGNGTGINGQPLQVTSLGNLTTSNRLQVDQITATFSKQNLNVPHDEIGSKLEEMRSDLYTQMDTYGYNYAYNVNEFICVDNSTPNRYNCYLVAWLSNV